MTKKELQELLNSNELSEYSLACLERVDMDAYEDDDDLQDEILQAIDDEMIWTATNFECVERLNGSDLSGFFEEGVTDINVMACMLVEREIFGW